MCCLGNFYRRFLKDAARTQAPLHALLIGAKKKDKRNITWTNTTDDVFQAAKQQLIDASLLAHPRAGSPLALSTDASDLLWAPRWSN